MFTVRTSISCSGVAKEYQNNKIYYLFCRFANHSQAVLRLYQCPQKRMFLKAERLICSHSPLVMNHNSRMLSLEWSKHESSKLLLGNFRFSQLQRDLSLTHLWDPNIILKKFYVVKITGSYLDCIAAMVAKPHDLEHGRVEFPYT